MNCSATFLGQQHGVEEEMEVSVPDEFAKWSEGQQEAYLLPEMENWLSCQMDSGFSFRAAHPAPTAPEVTEEAGA